MASKSTVTQFVTKAEAAQILGVEEKSVTHVEGEVNGRNLCLKQVPGLYRAADARAIRAARDQRAKEKAEKAEAARQTVERHPTGDEANETLEKLKASLPQA